MAAPLLPNTSFALLNAQTQGNLQLQDINPGQTLLLKSIGISTIYLLPTSGINNYPSSLGLNGTMQLTKNYSTVEGWHVTGGTTFFSTSTEYLKLFSTPLTISSGFLNVLYKQDYLDFSTIILSTQSMTLSTMLTHSTSIYTLTTPSLSSLTLATSTATFSTLSTTSGEITLSTGWLLNNNLPLISFSSIAVFQDSYTVSSIETLQATCPSVTAPYAIQPQSIVFTDPNVFVTLSTLTQTILADTSTYPGTILLPPVSSVIGGLFYIQDINKTFKTNPLTLSTTGVDVFFPQMVNLSNVTSETLTLIGVADNTYRVVQETSYTLQWFTPDQVQSSTIQTSNLYTTSLTAPTMAQTQSFVF